MRLQMFAHLFRITYKTIPCCFDVSPDNFHTNFLNSTPKQIIRKSK
jgi:hypothetical protein